MGKSYFEMNEGKTQCLLKSDNWTTVCWLPQKEATVGKLVKIKEEVWTIAESYDTISLSEFQRQEKAQREYERLVFD